MNGKKIDELWYGHLDKLLTQAIVECLPDALIVVGESGKIILANPQAEQLFGYARGELNDRSVEKLIPQRFRAGHIRFRAHYDGERREMGVREVGIYGLRKDGTEFEADVMLSPLVGRDPKSVVAVIRCRAVEWQKMKHLRDSRHQDRE